MNAQNGLIDVLLVEDNPDDLSLALHALNKHDLGDLVHVARDGAEALDFILCTGAYKKRNQAQKPKLILLDLKLPKIDGLEVLKRLKSEVKTKAIPIVVMTSSREERDIVESYQLGANSYIVKPVDFDTFTSAIRQLGHYWLFLNQATPRLSFYNSGGEVFSSYPSDN